MRITRELLESGLATDFKKWLGSQLKDADIKLTSGSRGGTHIRFGLDGDKRDFERFFNNYGIDVLDTSKSISGSFETYLLKMRDGNESIDPGTELLWVNNITGTNTSSDKKFGGKELTPEDLGFAGSRMNANEILSILQNSLQEKYPDHAEALLNIAKLSTTKSNTISLANIDLSVFTTSDLATISKNYGEVLAAIWSHSNMGFANAYFPKASNAALIDFYGERLNIDYPISVKSGGGGKVTIQNIIDALDDKIREGKVNPAEQKSYIVFKTVNENNAKNGIIKLHSYFDTGPLQSLSKISGISREDMSQDAIADWLNSFENKEDLKQVLAPFHATMKTKLTDAIWERDDRVRYVVSPLGEWIWKYLNMNEEIQQSLQDLARKLSVIQVNIDVKNRAMLFQKTSFKKANFEFGWAGYAAGNKLGFKMSLK